MSFSLCTGRTDGHPCQNLVTMVRTPLFSCSVKVAQHPSTASCKLSTFGLILKFLRHLVGAQTVHARGSDCAVWDGQDEWGILH